MWHGISMTMTHENPLLTQPIPALIRKIGIPVSIGIFFNTMFNVVDTFYGGMISEETLSALSLSFPIYFILIALGFGMGTGTTALIGNALGAKHQDEAERYVVQALLFGVVLSAIVTMIGLAVSPFLFGVLGASGSYLADALRYIRPIFMGSVFFILVYMLSSMLNAVGKTTPFRNFLIGGFLLNILLDPWFIFGGFGLPPLGIAGIAYATVLVQLLGVLYLGFELSRTELVSVRSVGHLRPRWQPIQQIVQQGFPASLEMSTISVGVFIITYFISQFGPNAVAAYGVAARIDQIAMLPLVGIEIATLSLVAQNNGAGLLDRVRLTMSTSLRYGVVIMLIGTVLVLLFSQRLMGLFTTEQNIIDIGSAYLQVRAFGLLPTAFIFISSSVMRGMKRPLFALLLGTGRMIVIPAGLIIIATQFFDAGLTGIWWSILIATVVTGIVGYWWASRLTAEPVTAAQPVVVSGP